LNGNVRPQRRGTTSLASSGGGKTDLRSGLLSGLPRPFRRQVHVPHTRKSRIISTYGAGSPVELGTESLITLNALRAPARSRLEPIRRVAAHAEAHDRLDVALGNAGARPPFLLPGIAAGRSYDGLITLRLGSGTQVRVDLRDRPTLV